MLARPHIKKEEREQNYQNIIENLTDKLDVVDNIKKDVQEIKESMHKKNIKILENLVYI